VTLIARNIDLLRSVKRGQSTCSDVFVIAKQH